MRSCSPTFWKRFPTPTQLFPKMRSSKLLPVVKRHVRGKMQQKTKRKGMMRGEKHRLCGKSCFSFLSLIVQRTRSFEFWLNNNNHKVVPLFNSPLNQEEKTFWHNFLALKKPSISLLEKKVKTWLSHVSRKKKDETEDAGITGVPSEPRYGTCCQTCEYVVVDFILQ